MREPAETEKFAVGINDRDGVTAILYGALKKNRAGISVLLGHGAGASQTSPFMRLFASGLAERGLDALTFNFLYMEQGRRVPDPKPKLEACYRAVIKAVLEHRKLKGNRLVVGGKSMGGRIASHVAAGEKNNSASDRVSLRVAGLVLLGYPLHPPGKPQQMRDAHLKAIRAPILFIQGSRDAFGRPDELRVVIERDRLPATLQVIDGGDHSFKVPKTSLLPQQQVFETTMDQIAHWSAAL
ncbi:MAG: alpha/beta fold hydrolase [Pyrinomonadaceae bacterium]|nr:alpha/beta fold hydrolase [Pyrinomonadaceae bacterium]